MLSVIGGVIGLLLASWMIDAVAAFKPPVAIPLMIALRLDRGVLLFTGLLALLLAAIGVFGVMSYTVAQRTRELGIRIALGANTSNILRLVLGQGIVLTTLGSALGLAAALIGARWLGGLLFGVNALDLTTFAVVALLLAAAALLACWIPARRATKVDPMVALRWE
jgi:putative ABC transport system permease protein